MKYLRLDQVTLEVIDTFFNSMFSYYQINNKDVELYSIFPWNHDFNSMDIQIMFEDLQNELYLSNYFPKRYLKSPIIFLNSVMKRISNLSMLYLKPYKTTGIFRTYYLEYR